MFGLDGISSRALQKYYYQRYGTTLSGLMQEHDQDPEPFLAFAHDIDRSSLPPHLPLAEAIAALPGRKLIMTNGSANHAVETAKQLGIHEHFEDVFDIVAAGFIPKPSRDAYMRFFDKHRVDPAHAAMFEDLAPNLLVPHTEGMTTVLVVPEPAAMDHREAWEKAAQAAPHVDHVTADLAGFLQGLGRRGLDGTTKGEVE